MSGFNVKPFILAIGAIFCLSLLFYCAPAQALSTKIRQVRTKDNPTVYYLYHAGHRKKAYLNADTFLNYGNKWTDVKIVSAAELNSWPEAKLLKKTDSPAIFYIKGNKKVLIANMADLQDFSLAYEPILVVNQTDLNQYQDSSYEEIGLKKTGNILVFNDLVIGSNNNTLLTGTEGNLLGVFRFRSPSATATIKAITVDFGGLYNSPFLKSVFARDEKDIKYNAAVSINQSQHKATITFLESLKLNPGEEKTLKVFLDIANIPNDNQTIRVELGKASNIESNLTPSAEFPLRGTEFKILNGANFLGQTKSQEASIFNNTQAISFGNRLIGKFTLTEETGREDVIVKSLVFRNSGSAGKDDWDDFRLFNNGQIIARTSIVNADREIVFDISYLRLHKGTPAVLTIVAGLQTDYDKQATVNLNLRSLLSIGKTYNSALIPQISNFDETIMLN